jgi:hypothetical protein
MKRLQFVPPSHTRRLHSAECSATIHRRFPHIDFPLGLDAHDGRNCANRQLDDRSKRSFKENLNGRERLSHVTLARTTAGVECQYSVKNLRNGTLRWLPTHSARPSPTIPKLGPSLRSQRTRVVLSIGYKQWQA